MSSIVVGFSKARHWYSFGSKLICLVMRTPYSHVYIRFKSEKYDEWLIYEAKSSGIRFVGLYNFLKQSDIIEEFEIPFSEKSKTSMIKRAIQNCGSPYGFMQVFGKGLSLLFGWKLLWNKNQDCSELVGIELSSDFIDFSSSYPNLNEVTPKDIFDFMSVYFPDCRIK